ncbi:acyltransferase family protein [Arthrobacter sp. NPDC090010]|uniref:acyltransferase family protein n=1 Tax=Arthrobacter sp. NPDC090010 TaxID=3363942 RepID=UPI003816A2E5
MEANRPGTGAARARAGGLARLGGAIPGARHLRTVTKVRNASFRADIQGLRAVAVLSVVADHLFHWPSGGFIGVDIFFVISGFLITGLLIREWERTGHISFRDFYRRRVKRILPASLLVIVVTVTLALVLFPFSRFIETVWDGIWSTLFAANWRFLITGSDYFQADGPVSPLRHYWSLAVEEQFYFVWPWLMLGVLLLARKFLSVGKTALRVAAVVIAVLTALSFVWSLQETVSASTMAYYDTFSRAWELGIGALLAFGRPLFQRIPDAVRPWLANLGLLGLVLSLAFVSPTAGFPAPAGLAPVLATAAVIVAGCGGAQRAIPVLTNRVSQYLGDISFSLYLWHFPVIIFLGVFLDVDPGYYVLAGLLTFALSALSFMLVEDPIRRSGWLVPRAKRRPASPGRAAWSLPVRPVFAAGLSILLLLGITVLRAQGSLSPVEVPKNAVGASAHGPAFPVDGPAVRKIQGELMEGVKATSWPQFNPSMDEIMTKDPFPSERLRACGAPGVNDAQSCTWGPADASKHALLVGDSISTRWAIPLTKLYASNGWNIRVMSLSGCPYNLYDIKKPSAKEDQNCNARKADIAKTVSQLKPDIVFIGNTQVPERRASTGTVATPADWGDGLRKAMIVLAPVKHKVVLSPPPFDKDMRQCHNEIKGPQACLGEVGQQWFDISAQDRKVAESTPGGVYIDTRALYCTPQGLCPALADGIPIKKDHTHMTMFYAEHIQPALAEMLSKRQLL